MKKMIGMITILAMALCLTTQTAQAQEINMIDDVTYFETYVSEEDGTSELIVCMDGQHKTVEFDSRRSGSKFPKYLGKFKDCLVFLHEAGRGYRGLLVFRSIDGSLWENTYENWLCVIPDGQEACLFFYDDTPIKVEYNREGSPRTKFTKMNSKYAKLKGHGILSCSGEFSIQDD